MCFSYTIFAVSICVFRKIRVPAGYSPAACLLLCRIALGCMHTGMEKSEEEMLRLEDLRHANAADHESSSNH
jgi:hypothetical protein